MVINVGFDFGYGNIKAVRGTKENECLTFPTFYKKHYQKIDFASDIKHVIDIDGQMYAVGELATVGKVLKGWSKEQQLQKNDVCVYLGTALYELTRDIDDKEIDINLSLGLPIDHFIQQKSDLESMLDGLKIKANDKIFKIKKSLVSQQGVGAFLSLNFDTNGNIRDDIDTRFTLGGAIIDVGYRTVDYLKILFRNGGFVLSNEESGSFDGYGMTTVYERVQSIVNNTYYTNMDTTEIEDIYKYSGGKTSIKGQIIDISNYFNNACQELSDEIKTLLSKEWKNDINNFGVVYITGGGAKAIIEYLDITNLTLQENFLYANALGYLAKLNKDNKQIAKVSETVKN